MKSVYVVMRPEDGRRGLLGAFSTSEKAKAYADSLLYPDELNVVCVDFEPEIDD